MDEAPNPFEPLERAIRRLVVATVVLYAVLAVLLLVGYLNARHTTSGLRTSVSQNESALLGLCALRDDLERRVDTSVKFLKVHPEGLPGIPGRMIQDSLKNQQRTLEALDVVKCGKEAP